MVALVFFVGAVGSFLPIYVLTSRLIDRWSLKRGVAVSAGGAAPAEEFIEYLSLEIVGRFDQLLGEVSEAAGRAGGGHERVEDSLSPALRSRLEVLEQSIEPLFGSSCAQAVADRLATLRAAPASTPDLSGGVGGSIRRELLAAVALRRSGTRWQADAHGKWRFFSPTVDALPA